MNEHVPHTQPAASSSRTRIRSPPSPAPCENKSTLDEDFKQPSLLQPAIVLTDLATSVPAPASTASLDASASSPLRQANTPVADRNLFPFMRPVYMARRLSSSFPASEGRAGSIVSVSTSQPATISSAARTRSQSPAPTELPSASVDDGYCQPLPFALPSTPQASSSSVPCTSMSEQGLTPKNRRRRKKKGKGNGPTQLLFDSIVKGDFQQLPLVPSLIQLFGLSIPNVVTSKQSVTTSQRRQSKGKGKATDKQLDNTESSGTVDVLKAHAETSMKALERRGSFDPTALQTLCNALDDADFLAQLVLLGIAYISYDVVSLLYEKLPAHVVTRESLSVTRASMTRQASLKLLFSSFNDPGIKLPWLKTFYGMIGALSLSSTTRGFFSTNLEMVMTSLSACAESLPSLVHGLDSGPKDQTTILMQSVYDSDEAFRHKRPHSPEADVITTTSAPYTPNPQSKKAKTTEDLQDQVGGSVIGFVSGGSCSAEGFSTAQQQALADARTGAGAKDVEGDTIPSAVELDTCSSVNDVPVSSLELLPSESEPSGGDLELVFDGWDAEALASPETQENEEEEYDLKNDGRGKAHERRRRYIQNIIMCTAFDSEPGPAFPGIFVQVWAAVLSSVVKRDPLETMGDAAMHVVMLEVLIELVGFMVPKDTRASVRSIVIQPLLSNATFLHYLRSRSFFNEQHLPKFPGNAFEVLASAVVISQSLLVLKNWVRETFRPVIEAVIAAALVYQDDGAKDWEAAKAKYRDTNPRGDTDAAEPPAGKRQRSEPFSMKGRRRSKLEGKLLTKRQGKTSQEDMPRPVAKGTGSQTSENTSSLSLISSDPPHGSFDFAAPFPVSPPTTYDATMTMSVSQYMPMVDPLKFLTDPLLLPQTPEATDVPVHISASANTADAQQFLEGRGAHGGRCPLRLGRAMKK
ncbi:hypothetical protein R3P38DRAFT_1325045 [Favolaschia claudopus]|uniref:Uncharacterized protein n=1 Tax=Favolaschia claudopus TaxID=2862362 RepID=A0AAW0AWN4_9AGAR